MLSGARRPAALAAWERLGRRTSTWSRPASATAGCGWRCWTPSAPGGGAPRRGARRDEVLAPCHGRLDIEESMLDRLEDARGRRRPRARGARAPAPASATHLRGRAARRYDRRTPGGCEDCMREGTRWVHLRMCLTCGNVGCCDSSPRRACRRRTSTDHGTRSCAAPSRARPGAGATWTSSSAEAPCRPWSRRAPYDGRGTGPVPRDPAPPSRGSLLSAVPPVLEGVGRHGDADQGVGVADGGGWVPGPAPGPGSASPRRAGRPWRGRGPRARRRAARRGRTRAPRLSGFSTGRGLVGRLTKVGGGEGHGDGDDGAGDGDEAGVRPQATGRSRGDRVGTGHGAPPVGAVRGAAAGMSPGRASR